MYAPIGHQINDKFKDGDSNTLQFTNIGRRQYMMNTGDKETYTMLTHAMQIVTLRATCNANCEIEGAHNRV